MKSGSILFQNRLHTTQSMHWITLVVEGRTSMLSILQGNKRGVYQKLLERLAHLCLYLCVYICCVHV